MLHLSCHPLLEFLWIIIVKWKTLKEEQTPFQFVFISVLCTVLAFFIYFFINFFFLFFYISFSFSLFFLLVSLISVFISFSLSFCLCLAYWLLLLSVLLSIILFFVLCIIPSSFLHELLPLLTEQAGSTSDASDLNSRGTWFVSRPEHRLYRPTFLMCFLNPSRQRLGETLIHS